jgi:plasmid stability protein
MKYLEGELEHWALTYDDFAFIGEQQRPAHLDLAIKLLSYRAFGRFHPYSEIDDGIVHHVGDQLSLKPSEVAAPAYTIQTKRRRRHVIIGYLGIRNHNDDDLTRLQVHLSADPNYAAMTYADLETVMLKWAVDNRLSPPPAKWMRRAFETLRTKVDEALFASLTAELGQEERDVLLSSLAGEGQYPSLAEIRKATGSPSKETFNVMADRVGFTNSLKLQTLQIHKLDRDWREDIVRRVEKLDPWEIRRMNEAAQISMYAVFLSHKTADFTDALVETLVDAVAKIQRSAEAKVAKAVGRTARKVYSKETLLRDILAAALDSPDRPIGDVIFGMIAKEDIVKLIDNKPERSTWAEDVFSIMRSSWATYYRPMLHTLLATVEFESGNSHHRPLLKALNWISAQQGSKTRFHVKKDAIILGGVVPPKYRSAVIDEGGYLDRHAYELCAVLSLREKLRSREIWVLGAEKYKNPDDDIPDDFETERAGYYEELGLSEDAKAFTKQIKAELEEQLLAFNTELPANEKVRVAWTTKPKFIITPLTPDKPPKMLDALKTKIAETWPMTSLLDMVK